MSQEELAKKLGYKSRSSINKIEIGAQNLRQSKIWEIASALETTPSFIMGWDEKEENAWMDSFRENLSNELERVDQSDAVDAGINLNYLSEVADGNRSITLSDACQIADELGCSLDAMVGLNAGNVEARKEPATVSDDGLNAVKSRIIALLDTMTEDQLEKLLAVIDMIHKPQE